MFEKLSDHELNEKVKSLAQQERELTQTIVEHIAEVDRRRLFLPMGYDSLYAYLTGEIHYSEGAAQRRIDAARLLQKIPEISRQIVQGSINLGQISKVQKLCRQIKKESGSPVPTSVQRVVLEKLENQNGLQTDLILAQEFQIDVKDGENKKIQRDGSVRVELTFSKEEMELIEKARALFSNKAGGGLKDTLLEMAKRAIESQMPKSSKSPVQKFDLVNSLAAPSEASAAPTTATVAVKTLTPRIKKEILERDQVCQFRDSKTGKICGSKYFLQIDHVWPRYWQGTNELYNLRVLCSSHNKWEAVRILGAKTMERYLRRNI